MLKWARRRSELSQRELAKEVGVAQATVGRIEAGLVSPRADTLVRLLEATGHELSVERRLGEGVDRSLIRNRLRMTPEERIRLAVNEAQSMSRRRFDPTRILRRLRRHGVRFVLIGGLAGKAHGSTTLTVDIDICHARDPANLVRLSAALRELGTTLQPDPQILQGEDTLALETDYGDLDIVGTPAGAAGFAELNANAEGAMLDDGLIVRVASLEDLIRMKRAAGSEKDLIELEVLGALRDETIAMAKRR